MVNKEKPKFGIDLIDYVLLYSIDFRAEIFTADRFLNDKIKSTTE